MGEVGSRIVAGATAATGAAGALLALSLSPRGDQGRAASTAATVSDQAWITIAVIACIASGLVVALARPRQPVGWILLAGASLWGAGEGLLAVGSRGQLVDPGTIPAPLLLAVAGTALRGLGWLTLVVALPYWFPDGRAPWPGRRWPGRAIAVALVGFTVGAFIAPSPLEAGLAHLDSPTGLPAASKDVADLVSLLSLAVATVGLVMAVAGQVHRWRQGDALQRQQVLWFAAAFALPLAFLPFIAVDLVRPWMFAVVVLPVPLLIGVALMQRRLYDIRLVASRGATYVLLSACVALLYAVTVGGVGALLSARGAPWLGWVGAGVVAVSFAPLHASLRRMVNRITWGRWAEPGALLAETSRRLADTADVPGLLDSLMAELKSALGLHAVWVADATSGVLAGDLPADAAASATSTQRLTAYGRDVGALHWTGQVTRDADRVLLRQMAAQLGGVVHSLGLVESLTRARAGLVLAREEERRRLRRDLHDGLGPELAALTLRVDALRNRLGTSGLDLDAELQQIRSGIQHTVADVRRVVEGLRPPAVDELGLGGAVEQLTANIVVGPRLDLDIGPLPPLPAAVEVAAFRVAQEAVTNAMRHAAGAWLRVELHAEDDLVLVVRDDGAGGAAPRLGGVGLASMAERAEEVGGHLEIVSTKGAGTTVQLRVPLGADASATRPVTWELNA